METHIVIEIVALLAGLVGTSLAVVRLGMHMSERIIHKTLSLFEVSFRSQEEALERMHDALDTLTVAVRESTALLNRRSELTVESGGK